MSTLLRPTPSTNPDRTAGAAVPRWPRLVWVGFVVAALVMLPTLPLVTWSVVVPIVAAGLLVVTAPAARSLPWLRQRADAVDQLVIAGLYRLAFVVFTTDNVVGLFLSFAGWSWAWSDRSPTRPGSVTAHCARSASACTTCDRR